MRIVVKVGTSTLAHPTGRLNIQRMERLCKVLSDLKNMGHEIILWGGVMHQEKVFDMVRQNAVEFLNGYLPETSLPKDMSQYVVAPALGENPGIIGAMCLGMDAYLMECGKNL